MESLPEAFPPKTPYPKTVMAGVIEELDRLIRGQQRLETALIGQDGAVSHCLLVLGFGQSPEGLAVVCAGFRYARFPAGDRCGSRRINV